MPTELAIIISIVGLISTCLGLVLTYRNIKSTSPSEALKKWQKETDKKLDSDNKRLGRLEKMFEENKELDRIVLRSFKGILQHLSEGNHTNIMKELSKDIDDFLINK